MLDGILENSGTIKAGTKRASPPVLTLGCSPNKNKAQCATAQRAPICIPKPFRCGHQHLEIIMTRAFLIKLHLYLSAFFSATIILVALSGGLYLLGIKGSVMTTTVGSAGNGQVLLADPSKAAVTAILNEVGVTDYEFDYVKQAGSSVITRPTSRPYYSLAVADDTIAITRNEPSLQKRLVELHKGHGPTIFKTFQKVFAAGMVFIMLSGLWLGLSSERLRKTTLITAGSGLALFLILVLA
jgi:hypothetical protein